MPRSCSAYGRRPRPRPSPLASALFALAAAALFAPAGGGCESTQCNPDPDANPPVDFRGGSANADKTIYKTSSPSEAHLNFNSGAQYRIFHQLGGCPALVQPWVSFSATGVKEDNEALPAGNMVEVLAVTSEYILVRNDSCADYYLRVVAAFPEPCPEAPGGGGDQGSITD